MEDEDTICLGDGIRKNAASAKADGLVQDVDPRTRAHHDAIFAPKGSEVSQSLPTTPTVLPSESPSTKVWEGKRMSSNTESGVIGAAARARLALKGEVSTDVKKSVPSKANKGSKGMVDDLPSTKCPGVDDKPLFKTLQVRYHHHRCPRVKIVTESLLRWRFVHC